MPVRLLWRSAGLYFWIWLYAGPIIDEKRHDPAYVALASDTVSISVMEIMDNAVMLVIPGAMDAGVADGLFWASLALSLAVAFVVTVPVNRWLISRGRGHAVVHAHR